MTASPGGRPTIIVVHARIDQRRTPPIGDVRKFVMMTLLTRDVRPRLVLDGAL